MLAEEEAAFPEGQTVVYDDRRPGRVAEEPEAEREALLAKLPQEQKNVCPNVPQKFARGRVKERSFLNIARGCTRVRPLFDRVGDRSSLMLTKPHSLVCRTFQFLAPRIKKVERE